MPYLCSWFLKHGGPLNRNFPAEARMLPTGVPTAELWAAVEADVVHRWVSARRPERKVMAA